MATGEFAVLDFTPLAAWPLLINVLTHASLAIELLYPVLIWVKIVRPILLAGAAMLHLGIAVMSPGLTEFALAMLAANLAFVSRRVAPRAGHRSRPSRAVDVLSTEPARGAGLQWP